MRAPSIDGRRAAHRGRGRGADERACRRPRAHLRARQERLQGRLPTPQGVAGQGVRRGQGRICSLGIFKDKKQAAIAVARAKAAGLYLLPSPDKTRAKPGCGSAQKSRALLANPFHVFSQALLLDSCCTVKRKYPSTPANLPTFSMASLENSSSQLATVPARPLGSVACMQACMAGVPAMLAQPVAAPAPTQPTEQRHLSLLPDGGCLRGR